MDEKLQRLKRSGDRVRYLRELVRAGKLETDQLRLLAHFGDIDAVKALEVDVSPLYTILPDGSLVFKNQPLWAKLTCELFDKRLVAIALVAMAKYWIPCPKGYRCEEGVFGDCTWFPHLNAKCIVRSLEKYLEGKKIILPKVWGATSFGHTGRRVFEFNLTPKCIMYSLQVDWLPVHTIKEQLKREILE